MKLIALTGALPFAVIRPISRIYLQTLSSSLAILGGQSINMCSVLVCFQVPPLSLSESTHCKDPVSFVFSPNGVTDEDMYPSYAPIWLISTFVLTTHRVLGKLTQKDLGICGTLSSLVLASSPWVSESHADGRVCIRRQRGKCVH